ncbi:MAG: hypothetical protein IKC20_04775, partial [Clostridia bacterium]|nr:hypothetical protein [Clostridia bacterium]
METREETVFKNTIYRGKIINLRVDIAGLPDGREAVREFVEHNGGVTVAALTDDMQLIFVRQFRYPYMEEVLELPAYPRAGGLVGTCHRGRSSQQPRHY